MDPGPRAETAVGWVLGGVGLVLGVFLVVVGVLGIAVAGLSELALYHRASRRPAAAVRFRDRRQEARA